MPPASHAGRPPLAPIACALALGSALGFHALGTALLSASAPALLILMAGRPAWRPTVLALLLGLVLGIQARPRPPPELTPAGLPYVHVMDGVVTKVVLPFRRSLRFTLRVERLSGRPYARAAEIEVRMRLSWRGPPPGLARGAHVRLTARVTVRHRRMTASVHDRQALVVTQPASQAALAVRGARLHAAEHLSSSLDRRDAGLARALLLGDRSRLDRRDRMLFRRTGQAHLLAVSGLHVGLILGTLLLLLRRFGVPPRVVWIAGIVAAAVYVPLAGSQPSAVRAGLGLSAWCLARCLGREPRGAAVLALVAVLVLTLRPGSISEVSFQLSFAAVASILLLARPLRERLVRPRPVIPGFLPPRKAPVRTALAVSCAAWLGTAPFVAEYMGRLCLAGPVVSLLSLPLTAVLLGAGALLLLGGSVEVLSRASAWAFEHAAALLRYVLEGVGDVGLDARNTADPCPVWWCLYAAAFGVASRARGRTGAVALAALILLPALLLVDGGIAPLSEAREAWNGRPTEYDAPHVPTAPLLAEFVPPDLVTLSCVIAGLAVFALLCVRLAWLEASGAAAAVALGAVAFLSFRWSGLAGLFAPFLVATLLGKLPGEERASARDLRQVLCNGVPAFLGCLLTISGRPDLGVPVFVGALACLGGDSCATEIGVRYGGTPFRLAGRGPVRSGESGGVTLAGLGAALVGAALAPAAFMAAFTDTSDLSLTWTGLMCAAGVAGALFDSILGGWLQFRGRDAASGAITERSVIDGALPERVSGWRWLDNDAVNLVTGFASGLLAVALMALL